MKFYILTVFFVSILQIVTAQQSPFEKTVGRESATYFEAIDWYKELGKQSPIIKVTTAGSTDAGYPLNLVLVSKDKNFDIAQWHLKHKVVILINNGIHPGEPDGIDASMLLVRDIINQKITLPNNVVLAIIPVYNIGGCLNRGALSRVNQNGPLQYGFRGNSQNLDLNRDFTKCDSKEARSFTTLFHALDPDILIDNHVSDGADYQHTMTLITTQYDKLGANLGTWLRQSFEPQLYQSMAKKNWDMTPYVNFETASPDNGMEMFYDPPRYSSGYAALFGTISFMPETHMLKPFADRVMATYNLLQTMITTAGNNADSLLLLRQALKKTVIIQKVFPLKFTVDSSKFSYINFKGYQQAYTTSDATGLQKMYYDHSKPFTKPVKFYNSFTGTNFITKPKAYIIDQGWQNVIELLKLNNVKMESFTRDTVLSAEIYHIEDYHASPRAYEKHHKNTGVKITASKQTIHILKGAVYIPLNQIANRYIIEMLEPTGEDSFFSWNFFDAILQQKEGYSDYRWDDIAAKVLKENPELQKKLTQKKLEDSKFATDAAAQLQYIYLNSPYYEPEHLRYPVFRVL